MKYEVHINDIKVVETEDETVAQDFLETKFGQAINQMSADNPVLPNSFKAVFIDRVDRKRLSFNIQLEEYHD